MATIFETLQNAKHNLDIYNARPFMQQVIGRQQLMNAVTLLEKGYDIDCDVDQILEAFEELDFVPYAEIVPQLAPDTSVVAELISFYNTCVRVSVDFKVTEGLTSEIHPDTKYLSELICIASDAMMK